jgi:hypothetical protein
LRTLAANLVMGALLIGTKEWFSWQDIPASGRVVQLGSCILTAILAYGLSLLVFGLRRRHLMLAETV